MLGGITGEHIHVLPEITTGLHSLHNLMADKELSFS